MKKVPGPWGDGDDWGCGQKSNLTYFLAISDHFLNEIIWATFLFIFFLFNPPPPPFQTVY